MQSTLTSILPSLLILGLVALAAFGLARQTRRTAGVVTARALIVAVVVQTLHFAEEWTTGFNKQFPELFGQPAMPETFFVIFNLAWIVIWVVSVPGLRSGKLFAFFAAWFLALAAMLNGVAHPVMAVVDDGYFPGLFSSPFIGVAGIYLAWRLARAGK